MSSAESFNPDRSKTAPPIETVYTTVESQADRTDWLTAVSNLRQVNRQLVEEIARLEQALASSKQEVHDRKEASQTHEITILQQQDELKITHDRVGALFQQLENSHQIGQRQQILIETLSQQLEISQAIIPQLEAENEEISQKYQQQAQKLTKTERVAIELHRRLKLQTAAVERLSTSNLDLLSPVTTEIANSIPDNSHAETLATENTDTESTSQYSVVEKTPDLTDPNTTIADCLSAQAEVDLHRKKLDARAANIEIGNKTPSQPIYLPHEEIPSEISTELIALETLPSPPKSSPQIDWREAIAMSNAKNVYKSPDPSPINTPIASETIDKDHLFDEEPIVRKSASNWPSPTVTRDRVAAQTVKIDLPKFPKKQEK